MHLVKVCEDSGAAEYIRYSLEAHGGDALDRSRSLADIPWSRQFEDVIAVGIEEPAGKMTGRLFRVQGAILAKLPRELLVQPFMPSQWRKAVGLKGLCGKPDVAEFANHYMFEHGEANGFSYVEWPQDAKDALCMALAVSKLVQSEAAA